MSCLRLHGLAFPASAHRYTFRPPELFPRAGPVLTWPLPVSVCATTSRLSHSFPIQECAASPKHLPRSFGSLPTRLLETTKPAASVSPQKVSLQSPRSYAHMPCT